MFFYELKMLCKESGVFLKAAQGLRKVVIVWDIWMMSGWIECGEKYTEHR